MKPGAGKTVLIVDDDADIRFTVRLVLEDEGYDVACAANGLEALRYLRSGKTPQLILLDLSMPVMNGFQFREEQRRDHALAAIPVAVISATDRLDDKVRSLEVRGHIQKPVNLDDLLATVARCCAPRGARPAS